MSEQIRETENFSADLDRIIRLALRKFIQNNPLFSFVQAFTDENGFIQRDVGDSKQIIDERSRLNIVAHKDTIDIYIPSNNVIGYAKIMSDIMTEIVGLPYPITALANSPNKAETYRGQERAANSIFVYVTVVTRSKVPYPDKTQKDGTFVALNVTTSLQLS